jgi:hypothetical protein
MGNERLGGRTSTVGSIERLGRVRRSFAALAHTWLLPVLASSFHMH